MYFSWRKVCPLAITGLSLLLFGSCARKPQPAIQRLAILRFENLTGDPAMDWMGRAFAEVITAELSRASNIYAIPTSRLHTLNQAMGVRPVSAPGISAEAPLALAMGANRLGYGEYSVVNGQIRTRLTSGRFTRGPVGASTHRSLVWGLRCDRRGRRPCPAALKRRSAV